MERRSWRFLLGILVACGGPLGVTADGPEGAVDSIELSVSSPPFLRDTVLVRPGDVLSLKFVPRNNRGLWVTDVTVLLYDVVPEGIVARTSDAPGGDGGLQPRYTALAVGAATLTARTPAGVRTTTGQPVVWRGTILVAPP